MGRIIGVPAGLIAALFLVAAQAHGETASYTAHLSTSRGNPVYDILILEADAQQQVHATVYADELPGRGIAVLSHEVAFTPVRTLVIGLTEGQDVDGTDKTQIVMFLDPAFAAAHSEVPFSTVFPGARHSLTIDNLRAAVQGDAAQLAWFTDTFFSGPAAGAAFASRGPFAVAEFTSLTIIGANATFGNWVINSSTTLPFADPGAQSNRATEVIDETAVDNGPFDITFTLSGAGQFAADKTVTNDTGVPWTSFEMRLGTGSGASFVPSAPGDGVSFVAALPNREESGAFPDLVVGEDRIVFHGFLPPGGTAHFIVFVNTNSTTVTLRQIAVSRTAAAPLMGPWSLALAALLLCALGAWRLRRPGGGLAEHRRRA